MSVASEALQAVIVDLASELAVQSLARPVGLLADTTRGSYGAYLSTLQRLADQSPILMGSDQARNAEVWGLVLIRAGADKRGVLDALRAGWGFTL